MPSIIRKTTSSPCVRTSYIITNTRRILYIIHIASTARTVAPDGYRRGRWTPKGKEPSQDHSSSEILKNLLGILEPALQRNHVATDVLVLLADMVTYHLRGVWKPQHRHWPTRPPPNKDRVNDGLAPHTSRKRVKREAH